MDSDRIQTDMDSDTTIYHILIRIQILSDTNAKRISRIQIRIRIPIAFEDNMYFVYIDSFVYNKIIMDEGI